MLSAAGVRNPFPDPRKAPKHGLLAVGGDLSVEMLLTAYDHGIFPWFNEGDRPHWWSPDPRAVMDLEHLHVSRSLARTLRRGGFTTTWNRAFRRVMEECGQGRREGTWIVAEMLRAYTRLNEAGHAHSIEVWKDGALAGGLYGVQRGGAFMAESMFHRETNASKIALVRAIQDLWSAGVRLFDVQFLTPHLKSMGAYEIRRTEYLDRLAVARRLAARAPDA
jgi:leucyl/phenylalanyl-tRNA--protein transferase